MVAKLLMIKKKKDKIWVVGAMKASWTRLLLRTMSGFVALQRPGSGVMFMALVPAKGSAESQGLVSSLRQY